MSDLQGELAAVVSCIHWQHWIRCLYSLFLSFVHEVLSDYMTFQFLSFFSRAYTAYVLVPTLQRSGKCPACCKLYRSLCFEIRARRSCRSTLSYLESFTSQTKCQEPQQSLTTPLYISHAVLLPSQHPISQPLTTTSFKPSLSMPSQSSLPADLEALFTIYSDNPPVLLQALMPVLCNHLRTDRIFIQPRNPLTRVCKVLRWRRSEDVPWPDFEGVVPGMWFREERWEEEDPLCMLSCFVM